MFDAEGASPVGVPPPGPPAELERVAIVVDSWLRATSLTSGLPPKLSPFIDRFSPSVRFGSTVLPVLDMALMVLLSQRRSGMVEATFAWTSYGAAMGFGYWLRSMPACWANSFHVPVVIWK